ncbi:MAG: TIGR04086 family membrane protein [Anaerovoracaceae bacterium]|jgi:putative membrane protein (TIGR04086 family)
MKQASIVELWSGGFKALIVGFLFFVLAFLAGGVLICFTPVSEKWMPYAMIASLSLGCFFSGMLAGRRIGKKGLVFGTLFSIFLILIAIALSMFFSTISGGGISYVGVFRAAYIPCVLCGAAGGLAGVNRSS